MLQKQHLGGITRRSSNLNNELSRLCTRNLAWPLGVVLGLVMLPMSWNLEAAETFANGTITESMRDIRNMKAKSYCDIYTPAV
jgi:hypothetical protein